MNTQTTIAGVTFKNPVMTASGTFGSGMEYEKPLFYIEDLCYFVGNQSFLYCHHLFCKIKA